MSLPGRTSRRHFLKLLALAGAAAACQPLNVHPAENGKDTPTNEPLSTALSQSLNPGTVSTITATPSPEPSTTPFPAPQLIIDGHEDIAWNAIEFGRDPLQSALAIREQESGQPIEDIIGQRTTGLSEWREGHIAVIFSTIFVMPLEHSYPEYQQAVYATSQQARDAGWRQLAYYQDLTSREPSIIIVKNHSDLETVVASWVSPATGEQPRIGLVMHMEGAEPIANPDDVHVWYENGLRIIAPAWRSTRYAAGTGSTGGSLTLDGVSLLNEMAGLNMILDLSHLSHPAILEALDMYTGPLIASHSNPTLFLPSDRGLTDEMIKQIGQHNGVIGIIPYNYFLTPGWERGMSRSFVTIDTVIDAIDYVVQLLGSSRNVALGSDFDGGFGLDSIPEGMNTIADLSKIATELQNRGYHADDVDAVMFGNWLRILEEGLPARAPR